MSFPRSSVLFFLLVLLVVLSIERIFVLPAATTMLFLMQQSVLSEKESCVLAGTLGLALAVMYQLPLAVGVGLFLLVSLVSRLSLNKPHLQTRDGLLTILFCGVLVIFTKMSLDPLSLAKFIVYLAVIIVVSRLWVSRRWFQPRRLV